MKTFLVPKLLDIKGETYKITPAPMMLHMGECCPITKTIRFDSSIKGDMLKSTILHEVGHALLFEISLGQAISIELHEIIVDNYANYLTKVLDFKFK